MAGRLIAGMKCVSAGAYLDVAISSNSSEEHVAHLESFFQRVQEGSLSTAPAQIQASSEGSLLPGFPGLCTGDTARPCKDSVDSHFPVPADEKGLRSFMGIGSYYGRLVKDYARL